MPTRMIEPQLLEPPLAEPARQVTKAPNAVPVRVLDTEARGHIGRRVLHQQADGELIEDSVWRWSSAPDRYLDTALRLEVAASPDVRPVDAARAPALARNAPRMGSRVCGGERDLFGTVEFQITGTDRVVAYRGGASQRARLSRTTRRLGRRRRPSLASARVRGPHAFLKRTVRKCSVFLKSSSCHYQ